mgnify:CR=1 FL=1
MFLPPWWMMIAKSYNKKKKKKQKNEENRYKMVMESFHISIYSWYAFLYGYFFGFQRTTAFHSFTLWLSIYPKISHFIWYSGRKRQIAAYSRQSIILVINDAVVFHVIHYQRIVIHHHYRNSFQNDSPKTSYNSELSKTFREDNQDKK